MLSIMCYLTHTDWGYWASIVSAIILVAGTIWAVSKWICRIKQLRNPFDVYYKSKKDKYMSTLASSDTQSVQITLQIKTEVIVEHVSLKFDGEGTVPSIDSLWDWNFGDFSDDPNKDPNIFIHPVKDGTWYWKYISQFRRFKGKEVKIGIRYKAPAKFAGNLIIIFTAAPAKEIMKLLSFEVKEKAD
jgi:hypothetical protein